ncbi:MAG: helix-turn-helix domain-containing protein [Nanopusillaceae archaeon]
MSREGSNPSTLTNFLEYNLLYMKTKREKVMLKAYRYRIYPTEKQKEFFEKTFGCVRFYWNKA